MIGVMQFPERTHKRRATHMNARIVSALVAVAAGLTLTACEPAEPITRDPAPAHPTAAAQYSSPKNGSGELRTDVEPLLTRFPTLSATTEAQWMSGTMGSNRVPGPSTYWIDAVVTLPAAEHAELEDQGPLTPGALPADFSPELMDSLPDAELRGSTALDAVFSEGGFASTVLLADDGVTLVLLTAFD